MVSRDSSLLVGTAQKPCGDGATDLRRWSSREKLLPPGQSRGWRFFQGARGDKEWLEVAKEWLTMVGQWRMMVKK